MKYRKILSNSFIVGTLIIEFFAFQVNAQAPDFTVFNMANTPAFTSNLFRAPVVDKDGIVYMGTPRQGVYRFSHGNWSKMNILTDHQINEIKIDQFNAVWIAQSGQGGLQALTGGVNYFSDSLVSNFTYYGNQVGLPTNNARGVFINDLGYFLNNRPQVWTANLATSVGVSAVGKGINLANPFFSKITVGINNGGSVQCIAGNENEVWAFASNNGGVGQILRYNAQTGGFLGFHDYTNSLGADGQPLTGAFNSTAFARALCFASDGRQWVGLSDGGLLVKSGSVWKSVNMVPLFFPGVLVNNNALFEDSKGKIYVGTSNGLLVYESGDVDVLANWKHYYTTDGLPSDNVTGIAEDKKNGNIVITTSGGVVFWKQKVLAELVWDASYLYNSNVKPKGVAADGVSRLLIKVTSAAGAPNLQKARVKIIDFPGRTRNMKGKLKKATSYIGYSEEANNASLLEDSDSTYPGRAAFWFWYVSPDDFANSHATFDAATDERIENVRVYVDFANGSTDSIDLPVKIVRPPLVLVHGLASGPSAWDDFKPTSGIPFISNPLFKQRRALKMNGKGSFKENALTLLDNGNFNSLKTNISDFHDKGFACSQVDYVCHSMGGLMLRAAINWYPANFFNRVPYNSSNYGKGYVHKLITINTPHNSSPIADIVTQYSPLIPEFYRRLLGGLFVLTPSLQKPFDFVEPQYKYGLLPLISPLQATPAIRNLQVQQSKGGINLGATAVRNHLITGNVQWTSQQTSLIVSSLDPLLEYIDDMLAAARDAAITPLEKTTLTTLYALNKGARAWSFLEWYSLKMGYPNFLGSGDLIVPLASQLAQQSPNLSHITNFTNSASFYDANHIAMLERSDVGERVMELLNTGISADVFSNVIPANNDTDPVLQRNFYPENTNSSNNVLPPVLTTFDKSKIDITAPLSGATNLFVDSILTININLKDTVGLAYIKACFQDNDTATISRNSIQTFSFKINPVYIDSQVVAVVAVYDKPGQIEHHVDSLIKVVKNNAFATSFRIKQDAAFLTAGQPYYPDYEVQYNGTWVRLSNASSSIVIQPEDASIASLNSNKAILGLKAGSTKVFVSYLQFKDTLIINVTPALFSNSLNESLASGSFTNPAIWSKGIVPDFFDSVVIKAGHILMLDTTVSIRAIKLEAGSSLLFNSDKDTLHLGINLEGLTGLNYPSQIKFNRNAFQQFNVIEYDRKRFLKPENELDVLMVKNCSV